MPGKTGFTGPVSDSGNIPSGVESAPVTPDAGGWQIDLRFARLNPNPRTGKGRRLRIRFRCLCLLLGLTLASAVGAAETEPGDPYADAVRLLLDGRLDDARAALERIAAQSPEHAGAWLDLAILQCNLGHADEAMALFDAIEARFDPPPAIRQLVAEFRSEGCRTTRAGRHVRLRLGRGRDSNANQGAFNPNFTIGSGSSQVTLVLAPEFAPRRDSFTAASAELAMPLERIGGNLIAQIQSRRYDTLSRFSVESIAAAIDHPWRLGQWEFDTIGLASLTTLGGKNYQDRYQLQLGVLPPLDLPPGWRFGASGSAGSLTYPTLRGYDARLYEASAWLAWSRDATLLRLSGGANADRARGGRAGGNRRGWFLGLNGRLRLPAAATAELDWSRQRWRDADTYSPVLIERRRQQDTTQLRAAVNVPLFPHHGLQVEYRATHNRENISLFEYKAHLLQVSWQMDFSF